MSKADFVEQYYERIATDPAYRARLLADPVAVVSAQFGYTPGPDLKMEIIEQVDDTVVIMVPPKPEPGQDIEQELNRVTEQVFDLLSPPASAASSSRTRRRNGSCARCGWPPSRRRGAMSRTCSPPCRCATSSLRRLKP